MTVDNSISFEPSVLVVDDEKRIRDGCHKMLTMEGFKVERAETGDQGLAMIEKDHYDIILLDLMMPGISGFEVLAKVKALHPDTAIIVITGYATLEHSIEAMKKGAFDFIPKPFSPQELRLVVSKALDYIRTLKDIAHEQSRMRGLINHISAGVMATDANMNVALANPAFLKLMGYHGPDVTGLPIASVSPGHFLVDMIEEALAMPLDEFMELNQETEVNDTVLGVRCVPFRDRLGRNLGTITVVQDITAAKKVEQLKSDFVSMVAHEIRGPMNSVLMQLKVVLDGLAGEITPKQDEILGRASERIKALVSLASELLDLAKIESGLITQEKERLDLSDIIKDQVEFHSAGADEKNISLKLADMPILPTVLANAGNMEEVLSNLITNAIKYTPEGGKVVVGADIENKYVHMTVADTGFGLSPDDIEKIFTRFYRVKNEETRFITGTGLGLPIVKSIVEAHHGMIRVESEPGQGSVFHVYMPILDS